MAILKIDFFFPAMGLVSSYWKFIIIRGNDDTVSQRLKKNQKAREWEDVDVGRVD